MVKHNNIIPNEHFCKHRQNYVKTWFNLPARKTRRRLAHQKKAVKVFPRPTAGLLRTIVHGQTTKYNMKLRAGKGFSLEELKATGIAIDHRRRNHSLEGLQTNVQRLKTYKANLVVNPRRHNIPLPLFRPQDREHNRPRQRDHEVASHGDEGEDPDQGDSSGMRQACCDDL
ncbi:hypothetical protein RYX36_009207 [Vicia faba]